jgi:hypothetical protein
MFGDLKKHGFNLESMLLRHFTRLSRLTLAVALLYIWLMSTGTNIGVVIASPALFAGRSNLIRRACSAAGALPGGEAITLC